MSVLAVPPRSPLAGTEHEPRRSKPGMLAHRMTCRLCDSRRVELAVPYVPTPVADAYIPSVRLDEIQERYPLDLYFCHDCGHVQLLDVVDPELLFGSFQYTTASSLGLVQHFRTLAERLIRDLPLSAGDLVVDIGSNDGSFLKPFYESGRRVLGIDPARDIAARATASGLETMPEFYTPELARHLRAERGPARLITAHNVFAHADDLAGMAEGVRELLAPDGVFVFEVSYLVDIVQKMLFDTVYHEHLCYHSIRPLQMFFDRHGLELFHVERIGTKGGSIRGFAQLKDGPRPVAPIVTGLRELESILELDRIESFQRFADRIQAAKQELRSLLTKLKSAGKRIAGFGASHTVTTLLFQFELAGLLDFLVDDNAAKHGMYSPGQHLPVLPPDALYEKDADFVVILAWSYAAPIMQRHQKFTDRGGHFILPLPTLQII
jgi:SAM-dependent methyltransferase